MIDTDKLNQKQQDLFRYYWNVSSNEIRAEISKVKPFGEKVKVIFKNGSWIQITKSSSGVVWY
ncbi:hypothetical protein [Anaerophilus nitritogenes]|uniref:hypothetical protein n=1 Tax=Anaerophilus nitritogenes TaxID=2498136 RepID=UPI00101C3FC1|nr:hypothetical protein [Anaerophilus nitritogenes]